MPQRIARQYVTTEGRTVTLRVPSGSEHHGITPAGSKFSIYTRRDEFGRGHSHAIWGTIHNGRHVTLSRNVSATDVLRLVRHYESRGITRIAADLEAF